MSKRYDFSGWATKNDLLCADGRTIRRGAFAEQNGEEVPLVWNHQHDSPYNVLGHALLENRDEGVYAYCSFNDTEQGQNAKELVRHGDIVGMSICANRLRQQGRNVLHGVIREVSLVLASANPGACIDDISIAHSEDAEGEAIIYTGENISLYHAEEDNKMANKPEEEKTVADVFNTLTEEQKTVVYALIGQALEDADDEDEEFEDDTNDGGKTMKHNAFENEMGMDETVLTHADQVEIIKLAKNSSCGSLRNAMTSYIDDDDILEHGIDGIETLFPDVRDIRPGAPELIQRDQSWVGSVIDKAHKTPYARVRTRQADITDVKNIEAKGYKTKGTQKKEMGNLKLVSRTTDPQTVYIKDKLNRDDIIDITDFDVVSYQYNIMKGTLMEALAKAIMVGDGREEGAEDKISEEHIRPIFTDDELYTIHAEVDIAAAKKELQGTATDQHFGENYVYAEAIITAALYAREKFKGSGTPDFYCDPHLLNVMLLARDLNGRRIYSNKSELASALNVNEIYTVEQFAGQTRKTKDDVPKTMKLLGIFVNMADYNIGSVKGGEITKFSQFDIDFNQEKYLIETRLSGALTKVKSAIVLEEDTAKNSHVASVE